jgi:hypothetical protein
MQQRKPEPLEGHPKYQKVIREQTLWAGLARAFISATPAHNIH